MPVVRRHFCAETHRLNSTGVRAGTDEALANRACAPIPKSAIVLGRPAFVGKSGDNDLAGTFLQECGDLLDPARISSANCLAVEIKIDRVKPSALNIAAKERSSFLPFRERRPIYIIACAADGLTVAAFLVAPA